MTTPDSTIDPLAAIKKRHRSTELALGTATGDCRSATRLDQEWLISEVDRLRAELATARDAALSEALGQVIDVQMADANRFVAEGRNANGSCGSFCGHGSTCHGAEAYAALNRLGSKLIALKHPQVSAGGS